MTTIIFAILGGILPALIWLWFWLREDLHPEPKKAVFLTFILGMAMIPPAIFLEKLVFKIEDFFSPLKNFASVSVFSLFVWAFIEEYFKYFAAKKAALERKWFDEPADALIYMITAALGFAALENVLFIFKAGQTGFIPGLVAGNLRFIGATLLHVFTSSVVGISLALSFFHKEKLKRNLSLGLFSAVLLHTIFNFYIIKSEPVSAFKIFVFVWLAIVGLILVFEKVKRLKQDANQRM